MSDSITLGNVLAALAAILSAVATYVGLQMNARKVRRENESDARDRTDELKTEIGKHNDSIEGRLKELEVTVRDFMPRREIEAKLDHEKNNRVAGQDAAATALREQARLLSDVQREQARFGAQMEASTGVIAKLEASIEKLVGHVNDRLDKMNDCLTSISRKVG